jgi:MoxR-like ATPase
MHGGRAAPGRRLRFAQAGKGLIRGFDSDFVRTRHILASIARQSLLDRLAPAPNVTGRGDLENGFARGGQENARPVTEFDAALAKSAEATLARVGAAREAVGAVIFGQRKVVDEALVTLLAGGHGLLIGVPGLAKTKLVETLGIVLGLDALRIQFTPDLMPSDILGSEVMEEGQDGRRSFRFLPGPIFAQLLMADEINRASPRTQSALLQAMQERHVTIAGARHDLPQPFHVLATQNPLEQEGAYPLPEAQLDRFLMQIDVGYPDRDAERRVLIETTGLAEAKPKLAMTADDLMAAQRLVRAAPIGENVVEAILDLVRAARPGDGDPELAKPIAWGPGPRAAQALTLAARARALIDGRLAPSRDDVVALAEPVLKHRMALTYPARAEGETVSAVVARLVAKYVR